MEIWMLLSARVSGSLPIWAMATGVCVEKARASKSSPTVRMTWPPLRCPEFRIPRNSSFSLRKVSASSISNVGRTASIVRKVAAAEMFAVDSGRGKGVL